MITINDINERLPYGKRGEIAAKARVSKSAVTKFLKGKTKSSHKIQKAAMEVLLECQTEIHSLNNALATVNN